MTYKQWAEQYFECARKLKEKAEKLKEALRTVTADQLAEVTNNLRITNEMYYDCMSTARMLAGRTGEC